MKTLYTVQLCNYTASLKLKHRTIPMMHDTTTFTFNHTKYTSKLRQLFFYHINKQNKLFTNAVLYHKSCIVLTFHQILKKLF